MRIWASRRVVKISPLSSSSRSLPLKLANIRKKVGAPCGTPSRRTTIGVRFCDRVAGYSRSATSWPRSHLFMHDPNSAARRASATPSSMLPLVLALLSDAQRAADCTGFLAPTPASRSSEMICSVVYRFRAISSSPRQSSEIAGFAQSTWSRFRGAGHIAPGPLRADS